MNNLIKILLIFLSINIYADNKKHYIGIGGAWTRANTQTIDRENMADLTLKYGYALFDFLDIEARGSFFIAGGTKLNHPSSIGLFLKPNLDITKNTNLYTLIGYTQNTLSKKDTSQINAVIIQDDYSFGGGFEYNFLKDTSGYIDYISYIDKTKTTSDGKYAIKIDSLSIGVNYHFGIEAKNDEKILEKPKIEKTYVKLAEQKIVFQPKKRKPVKKVKATFCEFEIYDDLK